MGCYRVEWKRSARKELERLDRRVIPRIVAAVEALSEEPRPHASKKLRGSTHTYRLRISDYRIVYSVHDDVLVIEVIRVGHRRTIYRGMS